MFVDVANMYYAARGQDVDVDYVALLKHATKGRDLIRAYAYSGLDPDNENQRKFLDFLSKNGYKPVVKDIRKFGDGRMKANLDIELVVDLFRLADRMDIAVIVSGDGDFAAAIRALQETGVRCEVVSFKPNTSSDLIAVADEFIDIMKIASIGRGKGARTTRSSMSAPEMPAKEVNPEFGFRDASPAVAAAALAAIKTGGSGTDGRRTRGGTTRRGPSSATHADEPKATEADHPTTTTLVEGGEETKRRRRRRGGRGRGRSRRDGEATTSPTTEEAIGWDEFDDLAQIDGTDPEHEYGFEEADAATLAELGIDPSKIAAAPAAETGPTPGRSRKGSPDGGATEGDATADKPKRGRKSAAAPVDADGADAGEAGEAKPRRSRSRKAPAAESSEGADAGEATEAKPRRSRSRKAPAAESSEGADAGEAEAGSNQASAPADASGEVSAEPQGIWGRFRSARRGRTQPAS